MRHGTSSDGPGPVNQTIQPQLPETLRQVTQAQVEPGLQLIIHQDYQQQFSQDD
ncbi:MAG: hypothetical protein P4L49_11295 [Desulfosporosinus sp.]|nr:hypothetical protein [Desulfosporosinus sp.]